MFKMFVYDKNNEEFVHGRILHLGSVYADQMVTGKRSIAKLNCVVSVAQKQG